MIFSFVFATSSGPSRRRHCRAQEFVTSFSCILFPENWKLLVSTSRPKTSRVFSESLPSRRSWWLSLGPFKTSCYIHGRSTRKAWAPIVSCFELSHWENKRSKNLQRNWSRHIFRTRAGRVNDLITMLSASLSLYSLWSMLMYDKEGSQIRPSVRTAELGKMKVI